MDDPHIWEREPYPHENGRLCWWRVTWEGNPRDGHWRWGYWYRDEQRLWRWCGDDHA